MSCDRLDPAMSLIPLVATAGPPPDAANAERVHLFQPNPKIFVRGLKWLTAGSQL
jgi:hypothetical protein